MRPYSVWKEDQTSDYEAMAPSTSQIPTMTTQHPSLWAAQRQTEEEPTSNVPLFKSFIEWYKDCRGEWSEVMRAASKNKALGALIGTAEKAIQTQNSPHAVYSFGGKHYKGWGSLGDDIEEMTRKYVPQHGHRHSSRDQQPVTATAPPEEFMNSGQPHHDPTPWASASQTDMGSGQGSFIQYLHSMEQRLQELEKKVGISSGVQ